MRTNNQETKDNVVFGNLHYYDDKLKTYIDKRISEIPSELMQEVTYSELKNLRDNGELIPGLSYRITDYDCMTSEDYTISTKHKFDIIVTADDEHTLNENARAAHHEIKDANIASVNVSMTGTTIKDVRHLLKQEIILKRRRNDIFGIVFRKKSSRADD